VVVEEAEALEPATVADERASEIASEVEFVVLAAVDVVAVEAVEEVVVVAELVTEFEKVKRKSQPLRLIAEKTKTAKVIFRFIIFPLFPVIITQRFFQQSTFFA
jgi:hypothetical protein